MPVPALSMPNRRSRPSRPSDRLGIGPPAGAASCQKEFPAYLPLAFGRSSAVFGNIGPAEHQQEGDSQIKRRDDGIDLKGLEGCGLDLASRAGKFNQAYCHGKAGILEK